MLQWKLTPFTQGSPGTRWWAPRRRKRQNTKGRSTKTIRWSIVNAGEPNFELTLHRVTNRVLRTFPVWPKHREMTIEHMILEEKLTNLSSEEDVAMVSFLRRNDEQTEVAFGLWSKWSASSVNLSHRSFVTYSRFNPPTQLSSPKLPNPPFLENPRFPRGKDWSYCLNQKPASRASSGKTGADLNVELEFACLTF